MSVQVGPAPLDPTRGDGRDRGHLDRADGHQITRTGGPSCARTRYEQAQEREEVTHVGTDWRGRAKPGPWYGAYYQDWNERHPGAWVRGELVPGSFYRGDRWGSSTLSWDRDWFARHGAKMPKGAHYIAPGRSMTPLTEKLNPTDTGVMRLQFRRDR